ncbi:MAG: LuxR C-terminal-related transcriptional regulator, partial [Acidimicrobiales bacterium]
PIRGTEGSAPAPDPEPAATAKAKPEPPFREADVVEIGASDLALSGDESRSLLTNLCDSCEPELTEPLIAKTEGWPAGLTLAGMALAGSPDGAAFVAEFSGSDRSIAEYLLSEVLANASIAEREFMYETSLLSQLCGDLCDAVTGRSDSADLLEALERTNGFVIPLDRAGVWFRYHHLLADLLTSELGRRTPTRLPELHARAYAWLRDKGQIDEAIHHALAADRRDDAADLVCRHWFEMLNTGRLETVRNLVERFEPEEIARHQPLAITAAWVFASSGHHRSARHYLRAAEHGTYDGPPPDGAATMESSLALTRGGLALDGVDRALADAELAYRLEPSGSPWKGLAALVIGLARAMKGDLDGATPFLEEAGDRRDPSTGAYALAELAVVQLTLGKPELAVETADRACKIIAAEGLEDIFIAATADAASALATLATGDERSARTSLRRSVRPMQSAGSAMPMDAMHTHLLLAEVALELGENRVAGTHLEGASQIAAAIADTGIMSDRLAELAGRLPPSDDIADEEPEFTERELEVITLLPTGLTTREIGEELFLSRNTIKTYLRRIYRKLDASSRDEAVETARQLGLSS